jgi:hypothetical protein
MQGESNEGQTAEALAAEIAQHMKADLPEFDVSVTAQGDSIRILVEHPLSGSYGASSKASDIELLRGQLKLIMENREPSIVRACPQTTHPELLAGLRGIIGGARLEVWQLIPLLNVLKGSGVITEEERKWLLDAGPPWSHYWPELDPVFPPATDPSPES